MCVLNSDEIGDTRMLIGRDKAVEVDDDKDGRGVVAETDFMSFPTKVLNQRKTNAQIGYLSMNLYDPPAEARWGVYNDRKINGGWVTYLVTDFKREYGNCMEDDSIEIAIKPEWIKNIDQVMQKIGGMSIKDLPEMEFSEEGQAAISPDKLVILGGNHRRAAVRQYVDDMEAEIEIEEKKLKMKGSEAVEETSALRARIGRMKAVASEARFWAVRLYDQGE